MQWRFWCARVSCHATDRAEDIGVLRDDDVDSVLLPEVRVLYMFREVKKQIFHEKNVKI